MVLHRQEICRAKQFGSAIVYVLIGDEAAARRFLLDCLRRARVHCEYWSVHLAAEDEICGTVGSWGAAYPLPTARAARIAADRN